MKLLNLHRLVSDPDTQNRGLPETEFLGLSWVSIVVKLFCVLLEVTTGVPESIVMVFGWQNTKHQEKKKKKKTSLRFL